ncbi:peroxiredoxin [Candidatus Kaiserbacteria bacterium]|nr:peroxiredoxin [Candidatus Kaiserbacteria bacterium]
MKIATGQKAPDFKLKDQGGTEHSLSHYKGKWILLYFYPKDDTPGCTTEAEMLRDNFESFEKLGAVVLGMSPDSALSHKKFAEKYDLRFPLLSNEEKDVLERYDVWQEKSSMGRKPRILRDEHMGVVRSSVLINPEGIIAKVYENVTPKKHAEEVLADIQALR